MKRLTDDEIDDLLNQHFKDHIDETIYDEDMAMIAQAQLEADLKEHQSVLATTQVKYQLN